MGKGLGIENGIFIFYKNFIWVQNRSEFPVHSVSSCKICMIYGSVNMQMEYPCQQDLRSINHRSHVKIQRKSTHWTVYLNKYKPLK